MVNRQSEAIFGYSREELRTLPLETLLPERFRTVHAAHRQHYFSTRSTRPMGIGLQLFGLRKNGSEFPVDISLGLLSLDGRSHVVGYPRKEVTLNTSL